MLIQVAPAAYSALKSIFRGHKHYLPVHAVLDHNFPGCVFVDDAAAPSAAWVWPHGRWSYVAGLVDSPALQGGLAEILVGTVIPVSRRCGFDFHEIYVPNLSAWMALVEAELRPWAPERHYEILFVFSASMHRQLRRSGPVPPEFTLQRVETPIVPGASRPELATKTKFGFQVMTEGTVVAYCGSNGLAAGHEFMVEVDTFDPKDRRRGFATAAANALIDYAAAQGLTPVWETTCSNTASRALARRLGFFECESYPVYWVSIP